MDAQGRFLIPEPLRRFAGLDRKVALIGQGNKFEIWDEESWVNARDEWIDEEQSDEDELSPELGSLSF
jgi:MraZ protein